MVAPLDAEFSVIGALLLEPKIAGELFSITSEQDFTREELHNVYLAARKIFNEGSRLMQSRFARLLAKNMSRCSSHAWRSAAAHTAGALTSRPCRSRPE